MRRITARLLTILVTLTLVMSASPLATAQRTSRDARPEAATVAIVSGTYRLVAYQTAIVSDPTSVGLPPGESGIAVLTDVTNLGASTIFDPTIVALGSYGTTPLEIQAGTPADTDATTQATINAGISIDGNLAVAENSTIRVLLVFAANGIDPESPIGLRIGDQVVSLDSSVTESIIPADAPALVPTMELRVADLVSVPGSGKLSVIFRDGVAEDIIISAVDTPESGTGPVPGCFHNESSAAITAMVNRTVWLEADGDGYLVWINNPSMGTFDLLQGRVVQEGFGGANGKVTSPYSAWLATSTEYAQSQGIGLWADCKTAAGTWKVQPTPAPEPTKTPQEIRAQYQWIDARDLIIRPGSFEGQKIVVQGSVFNIQVEGDFTFMQIWVQGGNYDAVMIGYFGDSTGIYEGTWVTVYGEGAGTSSGTNAYGGTITQPLIRADIIDH